MYHRAYRIALAGILTALYGSPCAEAQTVPGYVLQDYATVSNPVKMSFDSTGALYVGRDDFQSGTGDIIKIHRVAPGGGAGVEFGGSAITDPDAVLVDRSGALTGTADTVLVGHSNSAFSEGTISAISPDGTVSTFLGPTSSFVNPHDLRFDSFGSRLLLADYSGRKVGAVTGGVYSTLFDLPTEGVSMDIDGVGNIFVSTLDGKIRKYSSSGELLNDNFASNNYVSHLAFGTGGAFGTDLYALGGGNLVRYDAIGNATVLGTGFTVSDSGGIMDDIEFDNDALYVGQFNLDRIYRVTPVPAPGALLTALMGAVPGGVLLLRRRRSVTRP